MKVGFEKELFVLSESDGKVTVCPKEVPHDECGWLAEARGLPNTDLVEAIYSLKASEYRLEKVVQRYNEKNDNKIRLNCSPVLPVSRATKLEARRIYVKGIVKHQNFYGHKMHRNKLSEAVAGVHISFTKPVTRTIKDQVFEYYANWDWASIFVALDKAFAVEIKAAKRQPGFYEMKPDGRIEYRSLPSNVDFDKVYEVLKKLV